MRTRLIVAGGLALALAACATRYQEMGATGGVTAAPITDDLVRISARGNLYTDTNTLQDFVLFKAAETTIAAGRTHFVVVGKEGSGGRGGLTSPAALGGGERIGTGLLTPIKRDPREDLMIRLLPKDADPEERAQALDARQIVANVGPRLARPEP